MKKVVCNLLTPCVSGGGRLGGSTGINGALLLLPEVPSVEEESSEDFLYFSCFLHLALLFWNQTYNANIIFVSCLEGT